MRYSTEIWRPGILRAPISAVSADDLKSFQIVWLPTQKAFSFLADPFGAWRDGQLHVLCEAYDYRTKKGTIRYFSFNQSLDLIEEGEALSTKYHLSYPYLIEDGAEIYMVPEAHSSRKASLYRARQFPRLWEKVCDLLDLPVVDPSVAFVNGKWWMFFALAGAKATDELHVAFSNELRGPWRLHDGNPVRVGRDSSRPGGTVFLAGEQLYLPVQNCERSYGASLKLLQIETLTGATVAFRPARDLCSADFGIAAEGLHTLSACGPVTLFDVKHIDRSSRRALINAERRLRRLWPARV